jgi:hypothetical protein
MSKKSLSLAEVETCVLLHAIGSQPTAPAQVAARIGLHPAHADAVGEALAHLAMRGLAEVQDGEPGAPSRVVRTALGLRALGHALAEVA